MPDFTRKLTIFGCLLFTGFCFWKAASGLVGGEDIPVSSTTEAAMSPAVSHNVLNIYVEGEETPIGVTAGHPIWSEDRQAFIHSEKLQPGERLRSAVGRTVRITSIEPRAGPEADYNLEVAGEHVYSVTDAGLLVHNACPPRDLDLYVFDEGSKSARLISSSDKGASQYSFEELKELAATSLDFSTKKHGTIFWSGNRMEAAQKGERQP